ncbi:hypothetical protein UFOVP1292_52 [uncultured Caudovirales phage]|uniref:Uncharacterized protein n=1 Tax=uncultured Caudovirales phage TaxID=2100421 RepID=A0A6J5PBC7_9CAUD|nr:hypothetical protein UFOVP859_43 [uncultured Caudovirales phage]CAB4168507.1 hypothetical protein UFOVP882_41 [uncultured Caudovirales phage]CAB4196448.1 hypothetical protein UFOVP1292_52 [uncultured Caudovirales phage]CAB4205213.1 hypothetical protein UFOVP1411_43 [uncultured Caudovirales phage]
MEHTKKSVSIDNFLSTLNGGKVRRKVIEVGGCMTCGATGLRTYNFKDADSIREYCISGMCQSCQDVAFAPQEDDDQ